MYQKLYKLSRMCKRSAHFIVCVCVCVCVRLKSHCNSIEFIHLIPFGRLFGCVDKNVINNWLHYGLVWFSSCLYVCILVIKSNASNNNKKRIKRDIDCTFGNKQKRSYLNQERIMQYAHTHSS